MNDHLSRSEVWDLIAPVEPDSLEELGNGRYVAKWWKPVPMQDVNALLQAKGIKVIGRPFEPRKLPEGVAVHFSVENEQTEDKASRVEPRQHASLPMQRTGS